jgi:hypothetical protein
MARGYGVCVSRYCRRCERKRKCYLFREAFFTNLRGNVVICGGVPSALCQECAYEVEGVERIDGLIKKGFLTAWKPSTPIKTEQLTMPMEAKKE